VTCEVMVCELPVKHVWVLFLLLEGDPLRADLGVFLALMASLTIDMESSIDSSSTCGHFL